MENPNLKSLSQFFDMLKRHIHHFIFALTLLSLAALITWWTVFIHNSIQAQHNSHLEKLRVELGYISKELGNRENSPNPGVLEQDDRFEILNCTVYDRSMIVKLEPRWPELCVRPRQIALEQIEHKYNRLNFMLIGEAGFFVLIILVSSFFLYRFIQLERRTTLEVKRFWERSAHEIKTPITGVKAFLQNLKSHTYNADELAPYVDLALKQVANQEQLANNILSGTSQAVMGDSGCDVSSNHTLTDTAIFASLDPNSPDFLRLAPQASAPVVDAGLDLRAICPEDIDGDLRDTEPDLGADELTR